MTFPQTLHLFCRVVDNFGDIGVCWRLARQLAAEYRIDVTLWVDDLASFRKIRTRIDPGCDVQQESGVCIRHWRQAFGAIQADEIADVVIEAFGCELPSAYIAAMAARRHPAVWINLEYLSAEPWVEGCHRMKSLYPSLPLTKYFFFPGFSKATGGLLMERGLAAQRSAFQQDPGAARGFLPGIGVRAIPQVCNVSLFCYASAPVTTLFDAFQTDQAPVICFVPEGVASDAVRAFLGQPASAGALRKQGELTVQVVPFLDQQDYDRLLWSCDLNFVRGEDSMVRAQWAARPFVWQIYPQQEETHLVKLDAFLDRYTAGMPKQLEQSVRQAWGTWNGRAAVPSSDAMHWTTLRPALPQLTSHMHDWIARLQRNGDLASNLIEFVREIG